MTIRPVTPEEWHHVRRLAEQLVSTHHAFDANRFVPLSTLGADAYTQRLREEIDRGDAVVLVADVHGQIGGYVFAGIEPGNWKELRHDAGYVHDLVVDPAFQRKGTGRALLTTAAEWIRGRGITRVMLWTAPANTAAQELFRQAGFRPTMIEMTLLVP